MVKLLLEIAGIKYDLDLSESIKEVDKSRTFDCLCIKNELL